MNYNSVLYIQNKYMQVKENKCSIRAFLKHPLSYFKILFTQHFSCHVIRFLFQKVYPLTSKLVHPKGQNYKLATFPYWIGFISPK